MGTRIPKCRGNSTDPMPKAPKGLKHFRLLTDRQKNVIRNVVKNGGEGGMKRAMLQAGYAPSTAMQPACLTKMPKFREALDEIMSKDMIIQCLNDDILAKPANRVAELSLASKIRGMLIDKSEQLVKTINIDISEAIARKNNILPSTPQNPQIEGEATPQIADN